MDEVRQLPTEAFRERIGAVLREYPNLAAVAADVADGALGVEQRLGGDRLDLGGEFAEVASREVGICDRVGGGDSFASGSSTACCRASPAWSLECGVAHGALAMSTPGDTSMATLNEVLRAMDGRGARIER